MLTSLLESWTSIYSNHAALRTGIEFIHIAGLVGGGGCAIAADLVALSVTGDASAQGATVELLARTHGVVLLGLAALLVSGLLLFAADVETFLYSRVFWLKMGLIALLLVNGVLLRRRNRQVARGARPPSALRHGALASLALWFLTTLAGVGLLNLG